MRKQQKRKFGSRFYLYTSAYKNKIPICIAALFFVTLTVQIEYPFLTYFLREGSFIIVFHARFEVLPTMVLVKAPSSRVIQQDLPEISFLYQSKRRHIQVKIRHFMFGIFAIYLCTVVM